MYTRCIHINPFLTSRIRRYGSYIHMKKINLTTKGKLTVKKPQVSYQ